MRALPLLALTLLLPLLLSSTSSASTAASIPDGAPAIHPAVTTPSLDNYTTPDGSGISHLATTPNGEYVTATSSLDHAYLFSTTPWNLISSWPLPGNASSVSMSGTGPAGVPEILITVNNSVYLYTISSPSNAPPLWTAQGFLGDNSHVKAFVTNAQFSEDGNAFVVIGHFTDPNSSLPGFNVSYFTTTASGANLHFYNVETGESLVSVSMDQDGSWFVVGSNDENGNSQIFVYSGNQGSGGQSAGYTGVWDPLGGSPNPGPATSLRDAVVSADGSHMFAIGVSGFYAATVASHQQEYSNTSNYFSDGESISASASGCEVLTLSSSRVNYLNASGSSGCSSFGVTWSATFPSAPTSAILAEDSPGYFEVSWSTDQVGWFYLYPGMPQSYSAAYRQLSTSSTIQTVTFSANEATLAIGQAYQLSSSPVELTMAPDTGIPTPTTAVVSATSIAPSVGASTAGISVDWTVASEIPGFTGLTLNIAPLTPGSGNPVAPQSFSSASPGPLSIGGLSFSTNYSVTVTISAFAGARTSTSTVVVVQTASPPEASDPFQLLEYGAIGVVVAGVVVFVIWRSVEQRRGEAA